MIKKKTGKCTGYPPGRDCENEGFLYMHVEDEACLTIPDQYLCKSCYRRFLKEFYKENGLGHRKKKKKQE
jgi:hypothetical protein